MKNRIVGIDIGSVSVRAVELKNVNTARPVLVKAHEVPLPAGSARRGEVLEIQTVADTLKQLWSAGGFSTKDVVIGMGGPRVISRDLVIPRGTATQMRESLPFHVQDLLPVPVTDAILDFYPIAEEETDSGPMVLGLLVAAIKEAVTANVEAVSRAGLRPARVDLIPFAVTRALESTRTSSGLSALLSIGANTTNVVITRDGVPQFVRIIATGGDDITRALSSRLEIPAEKAESVKREVGLGTGASPDQRPAVEVIQEVAGEFLTSIRNTLAYFINTKRVGSLDRVVLAGGGSMLSGLDGAVGRYTGLPVRAEGDSHPARAGRSARATPTFDQHDSMMTAYGLALGARA